MFNVTNGTIIEEMEEKGHSSNAKKVSPKKLMLMHKMGANMSNKVNLFQ